MFNNRNHPSSRPAEVRPAKKRTHYTITTIGGAEELNRWKMDRERIETEWQRAQEPLRAERRTSAVGMVANQNAQISEADRKEIAALNKMEREEQEIKAARANPASFIPRQPEAAPDAPTLSQRLARWASRLWRNAFPE